MPLVKLAEIPDDTSTQARAYTDPATVERYAEAMRDGEVFLPVVLFRDDNNVLRVGDGYHRIGAARLAGRTTIDAEIRTGGQREARIHNIQANARHGLNFTHADKHRNVGFMLDDPELSTQSDHAIAKRCHVSQPFVSKLRAARRGDNGYHAEGETSDPPLTPEAEAERQEAKELLAELKALWPAFQEFTEALLDIRHYESYRELEYDTFREFVVGEFDTRVWELFEWFETTLAECGLRFVRVVP